MKKYIAIITILMISFTQQNYSSPELRSAVGNLNLPEIQRVLQEQGNQSINDFASSNQEYSDYAPLHIAIKKNADLKIIKYLLENGADVRQDSNLMISAAHFAAASNSKVLEYFLNIDPQLLFFEGENYLLGKKTLLHSAIYSLNEDSVRLLLDKKIEVNTQNEQDGDTPLHLAIKKYYYSFRDQDIKAAKNIFDLLVNHPEVSTSIKNNKGQTPLDLLLELKNKVQDPIRRRSVDYMLQYKLELDLHKQYRIDIRKLFN